MVVPAERVALHAITLPVRSARQRLDALPFALEDVVACGLEVSQFAIVGTAAGGRTLAAVVDVALMEHCLGTDPGKPLIAEQSLILPPDPQEDGSAVWHVYRRLDRVLVRASDGTGFALQAVMFAQVWQAAGKPHLESFGAALPETVIWNDCSGDPVPQPKTFADLRQGQYRPARGLARPLKALAACLALAALAHLAIAVLDVRAQQGIATALRTQAAAALGPHLPGASPDDPPALILRQLTALNAPQRGSGFLPMMERTSSALSRQPAAVQFRQLTWSEDALRLSVEAADLSALQQAEADLRAAGLNVSVGAASADAGAARADVTVRP